MTVIEIKPHRWGWKAFQGPGVEPVFPKKDQALDYAQNRACFRSGQIRVLIRAGSLNARLRLVKRIESCDCGGILLYSFVTSGCGAGLLSSSCALTFCSLQ
jgi:hypothetical protein